MWLLRRASLPLRIRGFRIASSSSVNHLGLPITRTEDKSGGLIVDSPGLTSDIWYSFKRFYFGKHSSTFLFLARRGLSSISGGDESETAEDRNEYDLALSDEAEHSKLELETLDSEVDMDEKSPSESGVGSKLADIIASCRGLSVSTVLDEWVEDGNSLEREDIASAMKNLYKLRMHGRALQFSKWLEESKQIELDEADYSRRVDLIAKVFGNERAKNYVEKIPESFRGELAYRTLLANYVRMDNVNKAEEVFNRMRSLGLPVTLQACNRMILLYKRNSPSKIANVLELMDKEGVNPSINTYRILIAAKGEYKDIPGMESVLGTIKTQGLELDSGTLLVIAKCYASAGFKEKALAAVKEIEGNDQVENRRFCANLLHVYGVLGLGDELRRVWSMCGTNPTTRECFQAITAWGRLNEVREAEAVFEKMLAGLKKPSEGHFVSLLRVYVDHKMLSKGKELVRRMEDSGISIGPKTLNWLVRLYVEAGDVEKADAVLEKATSNGVKPKIGSFVTVLEHHAKRGDIRNAEKVLKRTKEAGYTLKFNQFNILIQAYINAKVPAYGMRERLNAENIFVSSSLTRQLDLIESFNKTKPQDSVC